MSLKVLSCLVLRLSISLSTLNFVSIGPMGDKEMQLLSNKGLLSGIKFVNLKFCENYVFGKKQRSKFSMSAHISNVVLDYIHLNCWGQSRIEGMGGFRYFVSFVNDMS